MSNCIYSFFITPIATIWSPTKCESQGQASLWNAAKFGTVVSLKFFGRTFTLGLGVASIGIALKIIAETKYGVELGLSALIAAKICVLPPATLIMASLVSLIATGILTTFLIEKYVS